MGSGSDPALTQLSYGKNMSLMRQVTNDSINAARISIKAIKANVLQVRSSPSSALVLEGIDSQSSDSTVGQRFFPIRIEAAAATKNTGISMIACGNIEARNHATLPPVGGGAVSWMIAIPPIVRAVDKTSDIASDIKLNLM